jgi:ribulose-phosphate 3-epimerase
VVATPLASESSRAAWADLGRTAPVILPSLLQCDFGRLADEIEQLEAGGVQALHLDVMDGHFVPNFTYGLTIVEAVRTLTDLPLDAHLMIDNPARWVKQFHSAGATSMTIHVEATDRPREVLEQIHALGASAGIALNPPTPLSRIEDCLSACDLVLVMSVMPGFGGQTFESVALEKLRTLKQRFGSELMLEIDGGVKAANIAECAAAGAQLFVVGSAIFGQPDYVASMQNLSRLART